MALPLEAWRRGRSDLAWVAGIAAAVTLLFCWQLDLWTLAGWKAPLGSEGDGALVLAALKTYVDGCLPIVEHSPQLLNAPLHANWSDWPIPENVLLWLWSLPARNIPLGMAANAMVLGALLFAASVFYAFARACGLRALPTAVCAVLYALSPYGLMRSLPHITLTYYGWLPAAVVASLWLVRDEPLAGARRLVVAAVPFVAAFLNVYYFAATLQIYLLALVWLALRRRRQNTAWAAAGLAAGVAGFAIGNLGTFWNHYRLGSNPFAVRRNLQGMEDFALRFTDMIVPVWHRGGLFQAWGNLYYSHLDFLGEGTAYIGWAAWIGLAWLGWKALRRTFREEARTPESLAAGWLAFLVAWLYFFACKGGLNMLAGSLAFYLLRATNRYSIVIATVGMLALAGFLSRLQAGRPRLAAAACAVLLAAGLWDQMQPLLSAADTRARAAAWEHDQEFGAGMQRALAPGAMIFELPVADFPEVPAVNDLAAYAPFRPYLGTTGLRFSYGTCKGRLADRWQYRVEALPVPEMVAALERYGFSSALVQRKGYADRGAALEKSLRAADLPLLLESPDGTLALYALRPGASPVLPEEYASPCTWVGKWGDLETGPAGRGHWAMEPRPGLWIDPSRLPSGTRAFSCTLRSLASQTVDVLVDGRAVIRGASLQEKGEEIAIPMVPGNGPGRIEFRAHQPGQHAVDSHGSKHSLFFEVLNPRWTTTDGSVPVVP